MFTGLLISITSSVSFHRKYPVPENHNFLPASIDPAKLAGGFTGLGE
jgi:hypothetical protein